MTRFRGERTAFGKPGLEPHWTAGDKDGIGTTSSLSSRIWFTIWSGILTEVYYPTIDRPQMKDFQFLITDGKSFFHEEKRDTYSEIKRLSPHVLGYKVTNSDHEGRYSIVKEIIADPRLPCVIQHVELVGYDRFLANLKIYVLCTPHMERGGWGNNARVVEVAGRQILACEKEGTWMTVAASIPFRRLSCGYVGTSDGWTDLADNFRMDWEFDKALNGHVALTGELALDEAREFSIGLSFGDTLHSSVTTLFQTLGVPFKKHLKQFNLQWNSFCRSIKPLEKASQDQGDLYHASYSLLTAHEDKIYPGAFIASLSIPWGEVRGDSERGGYHLVWTRDMVNTAMGLLAAGNADAPRRALIYLAASQQPDGGFPQNFWINGDPYWQGIQLDEVAFPILLAWKLQKSGLIRDFDVYEMVWRAAGYLVKHGPATQQERWEEASGYSPSTLASNIAALVCAASFMEDKGDTASADFLREYADFLECHIEAWTVTNQGSILPNIKRHYIRINPVSVTDSTPDENPDIKTLGIHNRPAGERWQFPAKDVVDAGFLELVRYGIRKADDQLIQDSIAVIDSSLKIETPFGPCWHRYNHDGYGQGNNGEPFQGSGKGRAWPLLTAERAHYELAAGHDVKPFIRAMEGFASYTGLLPEQVWDEADLPEKHLFLGRPTGSAMPLMWAHAEYIKLLRSVTDGAVFDIIPDVAARYLSEKRRHGFLEIWKPNRQPGSVIAGWTLRVQSPEPFKLIWTDNEWQDTKNSPSLQINLGISYLDIPVALNQEAPIGFTFLWTNSDRWEGRNYEVTVKKA
ncbi:glycoside hydrolase family 15 protein [Dehalogenimonas formicexedens]|uniref:glycoside hydrolase family 15 protein n=1 Tax=Dehalogenimonas formicexedens TaxID=1839801 RepID=UPI00096B6F3A|nr:glycoside hydrolase family 15 protein [Dehalogenimonas formicexedens]